MSVTATIQCHDGVTRKFWAEDYPELTQRINAMLAPSVMCSSPDLVSWAKRQEDPFCAETVERALKVTIGAARTKLRRACISGCLKRVRRGWYRAAGSKHLAVGSTP